MALTDYSEFEREIADAPEPTTLAKGSEVKARIIGVRTGVVDKEDSENYGISYFTVTFDVPNEPLSKEFNDFFWDLADKAKLSDRQAIRALRHFKLFAEAFDIDYSRPFDIEDGLLGKEGWLIVGVKKSDEYGEQNTVQKYLVRR
jgi:hypothetical protein